MGKLKAGAVVKAFKKCRISNTMDGIDDDLLWNSDDEVKTGLPYSEWDDDAANTENQDMFDELFALDDACCDLLYFIMVLV